MKPKRKPRMFAARYVCGYADYGEHVFSNHERMLPITLPAARRVFDEMAADSRPMIYELIPRPDLLPKKRSAK